MLNKDRDTFCNCCGKKISADSYKEREEYLEVIKEWGYFSHNKDGQIHHFRICETCYDRWTEGFVHPVSVKEQTEMM